MKRPERRPAEREKRQEMTTYRELKLGRDLKTDRRRRRLQASGRRRVLGDGSDRQPYLEVPADRYREVRLEVLRVLLLEARSAGLNLPVEVLQQQLAPRIESLVYAQLVAESDAEAAHQAPCAALGRQLTSQEKSQFLATHGSAAPTRQARPRRVCRASLDQVLARIESRQTHNPARYQKAWAQVVGIDASLQTHLERIDPASQTAYFRCFNSVLSADLQRRPGLPEKLGRALGVPLRRLRGQF